MSAYWNQFGYAELLSMHGVELEDEEKEPAPIPQVCDCGNCMSCLGMSWNDFF